MVIDGSVKGNIEMEAHNFAHRCFAEELYDNTGLLGEKSTVGQSKEYGEEIEHPVF